MCRSSAWVPCSLSPPVGETGKEHWLKIWIWNVKKKKLKQKLTCGDVIYTFGHSFRPRLCSLQRSLHRVLAVALIFNWGRKGREEIFKTVLMSNQQNTLQWWGERCVCECSTVSSTLQKHADWRLMFIFIWRSDVQGVTARSPDFTFIDSWDRCNYLICVLIQAHSCQSTALNYLIKMLKSYFV